MNRLIRIGLAVLLTVPIVAMPSASQAQAVEITPVGERAFQDLARCLNTKQKLDVFYLIDESSSLQGTDPNDRRAAILRASLEQLGNIPSATSVQYAVGFFAKEYELWQPWTKIAPAQVASAAAELAAEVKVRDSGQATNWEVALREAAVGLREQARSSNACQVLVWVTDGGINVNNNDLDTYRGLGRICGVDPQTGKATGTSIMNQLRQANVVVLGVLLKSDGYLALLQREDPNKYDFELFGLSWMRPIVEGSGATDALAARSDSCGRSPIPAGDAAGALLVATDPLSLAFQFKVLDSLATGATTSTLAGNPARFPVDPGVARFRVVTTSAPAGWKLNGPSGEQITARTGGTGVEVDATAGATAITVDVTPTRRGTWTFTYPDSSTNQLFYFSGLSIKLNDGELVAGASGVISGQVVRELSGRLAAVSDYSNPSVTIEVISDTAPIPSQQAVLNADGSFVLRGFVPPIAESDLNLRATLRISTSSGLPLTPVSVSQTLKVSLPKNFPTIAPRTLLLSNLDGVDGVATGVFTITGPSEGDGQVCIDGQPTVVSDVIDRKDWKWTTAGVGKAGCINVAQGEVKQLQISASNAQAADGQVVARLPLTFTSSQDPRELGLRVGIEFHTTRPIPWWVVFVDIALLLLGFLIPFALLYLLNFLSTKIARGSNLQRLELPVLIDRTRGLRSRDGGALAAASTDFIFLPQSPDSREYQDPNGALRARVSKWPLAQSWYEVEAPAGSRVVTAVPYPARLARRFAAGRHAAVAGDLAQVWMLRIADKDLGEGDAIPATLTVFKRNNLAKANQHVEVVSSIATTPDLWAHIERLREAKSIEPQPTINNTRHETPALPPPVLPPPPPSGGKPPLPQSGSTPLSPPSGGFPPLPPTSGQPSSAPPPPPMR